MSHLLGIDLGATVVTAAVLPDGGAAGPDGVSALPAVLSRRRTATSSVVTRRPQAGTVRNWTVSRGFRPGRKSDPAVVRRRPVPPFRGLPVLAGPPAGGRRRRPVRHRSRRGIAVTNAWGRRTQEGPAGRALAWHGLTAASRCGRAAGRRTGLTGRRTPAGPGRRGTWAAAAPRVTILSPAPSGACRRPPADCGVPAAALTSTTCGVRFVRRATPAFDTGRRRPWVLAAPAELRDTC
ncbi:hypothetical protein HBB16_05820 [Pseudonocardia sp. MCCB 268]|nr:hypothetical protein [Pseudonocardia cytotoxica]